MAPFSLDFHLIYSQNNIVNIVMCLRLSEWRTTKTSTLWWSGVTVISSNSWFATTWQGGHVGGQNKRIFPRRIYMKIEFSSQRRVMLLFLTSNMAAVTSRANQQYGCQWNVYPLTPPNKCRFYFCCFCEFCESSSKGLQMFKIMSNTIDKRATIRDKIIANLFLASLLLCAGA